jgi:hypothetical protein
MVVQTVAGQGTGGVRRAAHREVGWFVHRRDVLRAHPVRAVPTMHLEFSAPFRQLAVSIQAL